MTAPVPEPVLRVSAGRPAPDELAALVVALATLSAGPAGPAPTPRVSGWADRRFGVRQPPAPGPGAWVASARP